MTTGGPLDDLGLRRIHELLEADDIDAAQAALAAISDQPGLRDGVDYLTARLLYRKRRLAREDVASRMRDLLARRSHFPEAARLLAAVGGASGIGDSAPAAISPRPSALPPIPRSPGVPTIDRGQGPPSYVPPVRSEPAAEPRNAHPTLTGIPSRAADRAARPSAGPPVQRISDPIVTPRPPSLAPPAGTPRGSYSHRPAAPDLLGGDAAARSRAASDAPPAGRVEARTAPSGLRPEPRPPSSVPARIRSVVPPAVVEAPASPIDLAALIDEGRFEEALARTKGAAHGGRPEVALLRARALARSGHGAEALDLALRVAHAPLIEPEVRAGCARLLVELGDAPSALEAARRAHRDDPGHAAVRLALASALARAGLHAADDALLAEAAGALDAASDSNPTTLPFAAGIQALVHASLGDPERALAQAQRALGGAARSAEALAAVALACARLGRHGDAGRAWLRLVEVDHRAADALAPRLGANGVALDALVPESMASAAPPPASTWHPTEELLLSGNRSGALASLASVFAARLLGVGDAATREDPMLLGRIAAAVLQGAPIFRAFVPYDLSLASLRRLDAALDCLIGTTGRVPPGADSHALLALVASYAGECVRLATGGRWLPGGPLTSGRVGAGSREWTPFRVVAARAQECDRGALAELASSARAAARDAGAGRPSPNPAAPAWPWDPLPWPAPSDAARLGRELARSIPALYCARRGTPLDGSLESVAALDAYLELLAPADALPEPDAAWARGVAALAGTYLGEVLRARLGGEWDDTEAATGPEAFRVRLACGAVRPVALVWDRLAGRARESLAERVAALSAACLRAGARA
ncbi:MAG: hypothetical protein IT376_07070 [Polyangiaceae bacterium]|nr:hypothetical protein [Polyangiaceae bacterium]